MEKTIKAWLEQSLLATTQFLGQNLELQEMLTDLKSKVNRQSIAFKHNIEKSDQLLGAYIPLVTQSDSITAGLFSDYKGCNYLTGLFLKNSEGIVSYNKSDIADAYKEMTNIITGMLIRQKCNQVYNLMRGMPVFVDGFVRLTTEADSGCAVFKMNDHYFYITIIKSSIERKETLPVFVDGLIEVSSHEEHMSVIVNIEGIKTYLIVMKKANTAC